MSWAEIVRTSFLSKLPASVQTKFESAWHRLGLEDSQPLHPRSRSVRYPERSSTFRYPASASPVACLLEDVPGGPIGTIKNALLECMPSWGVFSTSNTGNSACKILCHRLLKQRHIAGMMLSCFRHLYRYKPVRMTITDGTEATSKKIKLAY